MQLKHLPLLALAVATPTLAQRPANTSICDYYTTALLKANTPANQYTLLTLLVNTAVIGNYTTPNVGVVVPGILAKGSYMGTDVNLLPYFDGGLASANNNGMAVAVNFLDGGGAAPLMKNMPANDMTSAQYHLLTHLYQYFGLLLGCSGYGTMGFSSYMGDASMASVHRYMNLSPSEVGYFITQVGLSATSFGVAAADVTAVGTALIKLFDYRCAPPTTVVPAQGPQLQSICQADTCPLAENATCAAYPAQVVPAVANVTLAMGEGRNVSSSMGGMSATASASMMGGVSGTAMVMPSSTVSGMMSATGSGVATYTGGAAAKGLGLGAVVGAAALAFAL